LTTVDIKETFQEFDQRIRYRLKSTDRGYAGDKPDPADWKDLIDEDDDFREEFQRIYNDDTVQEADDYTPEIGDDTYLNMEVALPSEDDGPTFAKVTKRLRDANGIPIGVANDNSILHTRVYEAEYMDGRKASLAANVIATNMFAQIDDDGNRFVLLDSIVDHRTDGTELMLLLPLEMAEDGGR